MLEEHVFDQALCKEDIHGLFGLTYANYFVMPRSVLQSMPPVWQHEFTLLIETLQEKYSGYSMNYRVNRVDDRNRFITDPLRDYERGRRIVPPKTWLDKFNEESEKA